MTEPIVSTRVERGHAAATRRRRALTMLVAPVAFAVLAVGTMGAAPSTGNEPFAAPVDVSIADIQQFWADTMPDVYGQAYDPIPGDRLFPYSESDPPPGCGTRGDMPYSEVAGNAFYCPIGDFVAWDAQTLFPRLTQQFGEFAPALVLAHEWGHVIQGRIGFETYQTVYLEQQADCFAGAWAAHVASDASDLQLSASDLDRALAGLLQLSDPVGIDGSQQGAHGNGFDRVSAFQDGVENDAASCAGYQTDPPDVTEAGFTSQADYASGGDMSLDELIPAVVDELDAYWSQAVDPRLASPDLAAASEHGACDAETIGVLTDSVVYCPSSNTIVYDAATLQEAHASVGDFAAALLVAAEWSSSVQHELGQPLDSESSRRTAECMAGGFTASLDGTSRSTSGDAITLSPGDLDEVIAMLVGASSDHERGTAFSRVSAFRSGYFAGSSACLTV